MLSHTVLNVEFPIVLLNMYGGLACRATGDGAFLIAYSVLCLTYLAARYSFIFHAQVGHNKVHKDGGLLAECHYILNSLCHHRACQHPVCVCVFGGEEIFLG